MRRIVLLIVVAAGLLWASGLWAEEAASSGGADTTPAENAALIQKLAPSMVRVEYTLQFDGGEEPEIGAGSGFPQSGSYYYGGGNQYVEEERPIEVAGYLVSPTRVVTPLMFIHPRFVKGIAVRFGETAVPAKIVAWAVDQKAVFLELESPLQGTKPLEFDPEAGEGDRGASYEFQGGAWTVFVASSGIDTYLLSESGAPMMLLPSGQSWWTRRDVLSRCRCGARCRSATVGRLRP